VSSLPVRLFLLLLLALGSLVRPGFPEALRQAGGREGAALACGGCGGGPGAGDRPGSGAWTDCRVEWAPVRAPGNACRKFLRSSAQGRSAPPPGDPGGLLPALPDGGPSGRPSAPGRDPGSARSTPPWPRLQPRGTLLASRPAAASHPGNTAP